MARSMSPASPNFSVPHSPQFPYHPAFDIQEMEMSSAPAEFNTGRSSSLGERESTHHFASKGASNVEEVERDQSPYEDPHGPIYDRLDYWFGGRMNLELCLRRRHLIMISLSGTIGLGLVLSSSKVLRLGGSTGMILAYTVVGVVVAAVMSCIAEMVSLIPEPGALSLMPKRFVDSSLGLTVGITYW